MDGFSASEGPRDFLGEAARLALQLDPLAWEFDLSERKPSPAVPISSTGSGGILGQNIQYNQESKGMSHSRDWIGDPMDLSYVTTAQMQIPTLPYQTSPSDINDFRSHHFSLPDPLSQCPQYLPSVRAISEPQLASRMEGNAFVGSPSFDFCSIQQVPSSHSSWNSPIDQRWPKPDSVKEEAAQTEKSMKISVLEKEIMRLGQEKEALERHTKVLEEALMKVPENGKEKETPDFIPSRGWTSFDPKSSVTLDTLFDPPKRITTENAASIPLREYGMLWRQYLSAVKECLKEMPADPEKRPNKVVDRLKALLTERHGFLTWIAANNPSVCHCLLTMDMDSDQPKQSSLHQSPERRAKILKKMAWTEEQAVYVLEARNEFLRSMGYNTAALRMLQQQLSALDSTPTESVRNCHFLNWLSVARSLQESVEDMHVCNIRFHCRLYKMKKGITPYQAAILMVESYPELPDVVALVSDLASSRNAPTAPDLFRLGEEEFKANPAASEIKFVREPRYPVNDRVGKVTAILGFQEGEVEYVTY